MKERTLARIERDLAEGDLGQARDRLHGLIVTYPDDLTLREKLGDVYWRLQYPAMAGRYWYLEEEKSPDMVRACAAFVGACGNDPVQMLLALKFRGNVAAIRNTFAGRTLQALQERARQERNCTIDFGRRGSEKYNYTRRYRSRGWWLLISSLVGALVALALMVVGLVTVLQWIF
jgi:hypothetical protein